jgi:hypothetical protein
MALLGIVGLLALATAGCTDELRSDRDRVEGSGSTVTETRDVSGFTAIDFRSEGDIELIQGTVEALTIETDDNLMQYLETTVAGGVLVLETTNDPRVDIDPSSGVTWIIEVIELDTITLSGAGQLVAGGIEGDALEIRVPGAVDLEIAGISVEALDVVLSGAASIDLAGSAPLLSVILSGAGDIDTTALDAVHVTVVVSGAGSASVRASGTLEAEISGAGNVTYFGDATVTQRVTGTGSIGPG